MSTTAAQKKYPILKSERIPASAQYEIAKATFKAIRRYFEQPGVQGRFEAWKAEQERLKTQKGEQ